LFSDVANNHPPDLLFLHRPPKPRQSRERRRANIQMSEPFINKVAESGLITVDLEKWYPKEAAMVFDMKDHLFMGMILKEKDFREALKNLDWEVYRNKNVAVTCSADAIIPVWAYMLVAAYLQPLAKEMVMGDEKELHKTLFLKNLAGININEYAGKRVVIKGCGETPIADYVYMEATKLLRPVAKSIMYGEPCSTVPIYKKSIK
jgi:Protein of unknown function (DUF2480)